MAFARTGAGLSPSLRTKRCVCGTRRPGGRLPLIADTAATSKRWASARMAAVLPPAAKTVPCDCGTLTPALRSACAGDISGPVRALAFSPDGRRLVSAAMSEDDHCRLWDAATGNLLAELPARATTRGLTFTPDGTRIVCCWNEAIHVVDPTRRQGDHGTAASRTQRSFAVP